MSCNLQIYEIIINLCYHINFVVKHNYINLQSHEIWEVILLSLCKMVRNSDIINRLHNNMMIFNFY